MNTEESTRWTSENIMINLFPRHWILNAVPAIGTHAAVRFLKEKFLAGELTIVEAAQAILASVHMVTADTEAIKLFAVSQP